MTFFLDLAAAFIIAVNVQTRRARLLSSIAAGFAISLINICISTFLFSNTVLQNGSLESLVGSIIGGAIVNFLITIFAIWLYSKSR